VQVIRQNVPNSVIGMASAGHVSIPASDADIDTARRAMFSSERVDFWSQGWWLDPALKGQYPNPDLIPDGIVKADDLKTINQPLDFMGLNIYHGVNYADGKQVHPHTGHPVTLFHWHIRPDALYWGPRLVHERYGLPIYITENGLSNMDWVHVDGKVHDPQRIDFTTRYLRAFARAGRDGVDIRGYFHWSLMDNFEWAEGMRHRFGLVYVDYQTGERILKDSAHWYREVIASNGATISE
jgi:beta-glucosidase